MAQSHGSKTALCQGVALDRVTISLGATLGSSDVNIRHQPNRLGVRSERDIQIVRMNGCPKTNRQAEPRFASIANLHVAAAALLGPALRGESELDVTSRRDRSAAAIVADDLARWPQPGRAGLRLRPFQGGASGPLVRFASRSRRARPPLFALIIVIEERAFRADDPAAFVAVGLEAMLAAQRADPRRLELDGIERIEACKLGVECRAGVLVEQR